MTRLSLRLMRAAFRCACAVSVLASAPVAAHAQELLLDSPVRAVLNSSSPKRGDGSPYRIHWFTARASGRAVITLRSDDFDAFLTVGRRPSSGSATVEQLEGAESDDDGGDGTNARLEYDVQAGRTYGIVANTFDSKGAGAYELVIRAAGGGNAASSVKGSTSSSPSSSASTTAGGARFAALGSSTAGRLDSSSPVQNGRRYETFWYRAQAGEHVIATLRSSDFDAYLAVAGPFTGSPSRMASYSDNLSDDDGAGGTNARIHFTFPAAGLWAFRARSYNEGATGAFDFALERASGPAPAQNPNEARRATRPGERPAQPTPAPERPQPSQPQRSARMTLDQAVDDAIRTARAEGLSVGMSKRVRMTRHEDETVFIRDVEPGEEFTVMVLEENGVGAAWMFGQRVEARGRGEKTGLHITEDRSIPGILLSGTRYVVPSVWPRGAGIEFFIRAGPTGSRNNVHILVFGR